MLAPGSFANTAARGWMDLLFLSFTTLSGVGLGDIVPLTAMAKSLVMIEEFAGVMYLALVVSRLVALTTLRR
ncbi:Ion channel [compost metagenome]